MPINQQDVRISSPASEPEPPSKPYSAIPKVKTTFGLNMDMLREPYKAADYFERSFRELGFIFKVDGVPGLPEMVCLADPNDIEKVYRIGDADYPVRFQFADWIEARKELNKPIGMFLA